MIKKIVLFLFTAVLISQSAFAMDVKSLNLGFFNSFNDAFLYKYVNEALVNNYDLKAADKRVEVYRQQIKLSFAQELPSLSVGVDYLGAHVPQFNNFSLSKNAFILPFVASYEPDFLLKNHDITKSAKKNYEAAMEDEKSIYISLLSDVATNYINILQYDYLIANQKSVVNCARVDFSRTQKKFNYGLADTRALDSAKQNFETENNNLISLKRQENVILNNFATLIGESSDNAKNISRGKFADLKYVKPVPSQVASDVIFARPDVISVEKQLEKANIDVRIARKEFLPRFNITGLWAFNSLAPGAFFSWKNTIAGLLAGATVDIFKGGQKVANLKIKKAQYEELFDNYRQVDLNAVKEVNTALCIIKDDTSLDINTKAQLFLEQSKFNNMNKKYKQGLISYQEINEAKKKLLIYEQYKAKTTATRLIDYVTLYKATGGGAL